MRHLALIAIGGHALMPSEGAGQLGSVEAERAGARRMSRDIARLVTLGWRIVLTHGNGPQVGAALLRSERGSDDAYRQSLNMCVAVTQGEIGYVLQQTLREALSLEGVEAPVATILTQVLVASDDPALDAPTKPIGPSYSAVRAEILRRRLGWTLAHDPAHGYQRVVPSPEPLAVIEEEVIRGLVDRGVVVIALGGGGIPVVQRGTRLHGLDAVVDKDRASALLASHLGADLFIMATDVDRVYLDFDSTSRRGLEHVSPHEMARHHAEGHFPAGTMGPKVEGALRFLEAGGTEAIITSSRCLVDAVRGRAGTHIGQGTARHRAGPRTSSDTRVAS